MRKIVLGVISFVVLPIQIHASVLINEIAWMGTSVSANDEWIELYNSGSDAVDISGWKISGAGVSITIENRTGNNFCSVNIPANSFFLLERTDDMSVPDLSADCIYTGALSNAGGTIILEDSSGSVVDTVVGGENWKDIGGDNTTKNTAQRTLTGWITAESTPKSHTLSGSDINDSNNNEQDEDVEVLVTTSTGSVPPPKTKANAVIGVSQKTVLAGSSVTFIAGGAEESGVSRGPTFFWNMGDGTFKKGGKIEHVYEHPGIYTVALTVSRFQDENTKTININVLSASESVSISDVVTGQNGYVEISNNSNYQLDISRWFINSGGNSFGFSDYTYIAPRAKIKISAKKFKFPILLPVDLYRKDGELAVSFSSLSSAKKTTNITESDMNSVILDAPLIVADKYDSEYYAEDKDVSLDFTGQESGNKFSWPSIIWFGILGLTLGGAIFSIFLVKSDEEFDIIEDN